jgi:type IV pilus assembly protein PilX
MSMARTRTQTRTQGGLALITTMIIMMALVMLSLAAMNMGLLQGRSTGNRNDWHIAFQAAEAALRDGEQDITTRNPALEAFDDACTAGLCLPREDGSSWSEALIAQDTLGVALGTHTGQTAPGPQGAPTPRYLIERLETPAQSVVVQGYGADQGRPPVFRVTAIGMGAARRADGSPASRVVLQSMYIN